MSGLVELEVSEVELDRLPPERRDIIERYAVPLPASAPSRRRFRLSHYWFVRAFPAEE